MIENRPVPQRFTIEDIEVQDSSGVIFRALDTETGRAVAVRRFFPFGPTGGGLTTDEQDEYASALQHLETIEHPALRAIVSGGCDPVDGIPFIATEWVEGTALCLILAQRPLSRAETTTLLFHALEACEALSAVLGREGVWIETDPQTIILGAEDTHRPLTFWISPLRWLGQLSGQKGLEPLAVLTEVVLGWSGHPPDSHGASGLAGWLKWLRDAGKNASLAEARERLTATFRTESGPAPHRPLQQTTRATIPAGKKVKGKMKVLPFLLACCVLTVLGLAGWILIQKKQDRLAKAAGPVVQVAPVSQHAEALDRPNVEPVHSDAETPASLTSHRERTPAQASRQAEEATARKQQEDLARAAQRTRIRERGGILALEDQNVLLDMKGSWVTFEATLVSTRFSDTGKTFYLEFSPTDPKNGPQGVVDKKDIGGEMTPEFFQQLIGKTIRITGEAKSRGDRPEIAIKNLRDVEEVP